MPNQMNKSSTRAPVGSLIAHFGFGVTLVSGFSYAIGELAYRVSGLQDFWWGILSLGLGILLSILAFFLGVRLNRATHAFSYLFAIGVSFAFPLFEFAFRVLSQTSSDWGLSIVVFATVLVCVGLYLSYSSAFRGINLGFERHASKNTKYGEISWELDGTEPRSLTDMGYSKPPILEVVLRLLFPLGPGLGMLLGRRLSDDGLLIFATAASSLMGYIFLTLCARFLAYVFAFRLLEKREGKQIYVDLPE